jgi:hypothetical protein
MGHSSLAVSLNYLRGLELSVLEEKIYAYGLKENANFDRTINQFIAFRL